MGSAFVINLLYFFVILFFIWFGFKFYRLKTSLNKRYLKKVFDEQLAYWDQDGYETKTCKENKDHILQKVYDLNLDKSQYLMPFVIFPSGLVFFGISFSNSEETILNDLEKIKNSLMISSIISIINNSNGKYGEEHFNYCPKPDGSFLYKNNDDIYHLTFSYKLKYRIVRSFSF
ncbi:hypothetical protein ACFLY7_01490 [Patescibacteria group bacterium]